MKKIFLLLLFFTVLSCETIDITPPNNNNVSLETISAEIISAGGVILKGEIKDVQVPINYGFVFSNYEGGTFEHAEISKFLNGDFNGDYSITFRDNLRKDQTYYYNAVAYTSNKFIFGEEKSFVSNGSSTPIINSIEPLKAHLLDTIYIKGKHFSKNPEVFIEDRKADLIFKSDTLIECIIPHYYNIQDSKPSISIKVKKSTHEEANFDGFSFHVPEVHHIEPYQVNDADTITIYGDHFDKDISRNRLTMESNGRYSTLRIVESSRTKIKFVNPGIYSEFYPKLKLTSQYQTVDIKGQLELKVPTITEVPECISFNENFVIKGTDFPRHNPNRILDITIGGTSLRVEKYYRDSLIMKAENTKYKDFSLKDVSLAFFDKEIIYPANFCINEPWIIVGYVNLKLAHLFQNNTYAYVYPGNQSPPAIAKFNSENNTFESVTGDFIPEEVRYGSMIFNKTKLYHYSTQVNNPNAFKSYDIFTKRLESLARFPGSFRSNGLIKSVGDYIYFGLGSNVTGQHFSDIWRYSILNNTWEFVIDFPGIDTKHDAKQKPLSFVVGNNIYIAGGQRIGYNSDFWVFDTENNTISSKEPLPSPLESAHWVNAHDATSLFSKGYYFNNYLEEYDSETDTWKTYSNIPGGGSDQGIFFHNGYLYRTSANKIFKLNPLFLN